MADSAVAGWNKTAREALKELKSSTEPVSAEDLAVVTKLDGNDAWIAAETRQLAQDVLNSMNEDLPIIKTVLEKHVKPLFLPNPHPLLNLETGRALSRMAGGQAASQDYYGDQRWKSHLGLSNVVSWCIRRTPIEGYEQLWHLLVPPLMTFLDDYQVFYRLCGVKLAKDLLDSVPPHLLQRTGIGQLVMTSLNRSLLNLHDPLTPELIRKTIPVSLSLIEKTTPADSAERFDRLCHVLGEHIIGGAWIYASMEPQTIEATLDVLPSLIRALGIGTVRYLKALIPQCVHCITLSELKPRIRDSEVAALKTILGILHQCSPCLYWWRGKVIEGVGMYWIQICDMQAEDDEVKGLVKAIFNLLAEACPDVLENEYKQLSQTEPCIMSEVLALK